MKKFMPHFGLIFIMIISICFAGCDNGAPNNERGETLVCLGDSLTAGYGASTPGADDKSKSYPAYLEEKVTIPVINAGVSGDTTEGGLSRVRKDVLSQNPWIVIIELGANDLPHEQGTEISLAKLISIISATRNNLQRIIDMVDNGNRKIYLAKFYTDPVAIAIAARFGLTDGDAQSLITLYDAMYNSLASSNDIELIEDIWSGVWGGGGICRMVYIRMRQGVE
ncbi:MAG: GDSL-type esterase/lipase family protein [Treponema sp.]|jgi:acyl-CoA thioesterase-1|nr:GDSL-type esterase/lipase family protein [Treponema sp.]